MKLLFIAMIVLMPLGYGAPEILRRGTGPRDPALGDRNIQKFGELGLNHLDQFAWVGSMSAGVPADPTQSLPNLNERDNAKL